MWPTVRLKRVCRLQSGLTVDASRDVSGEVVTRPYLRVANVQAGWLSLDSVAEISVPKKIAATSTLRPGDVLMTEGGDLDKLGRGTKWQGEIPDCLHQNHVFALRPLKGLLDASYLAYVTQSLTSRHYFESTGTKTTNLASTSSSKILDLLIPLPSFREQRRIADFLDAETARIDQLVCLRGRMRNLLLLKRERVVEQVLELSEAPSRSYFVPLKYLVREITVGIVVTPAAWYVDDDGVPALRGVNVKPGRIVVENMVCISRGGHAVYRKSQLRSGDLVVVRTGQAGVAAVVPPQFDGANCIDLVVVRPSRQLSPRYAEYFLNSDYARRHVDEHSVGTIQSHFNVGAMKQMPVPLVSLDEQARRVDVLDTHVSAIDDLLKKLGQQEETLAERRQALITAAVTGQIDVTTARGVDVS